MTTRMKCPIIFSSWVIWIMSHIVCGATLAGAANRTCQDGRGERFFALSQAGTEPQHQSQSLGYKTACISTAENRVLYLLCSRAHGTEYSETDSSVN